MAEEATRIEIEKNGEDDGGDGAFAKGARANGGVEVNEDGGEPLQQRVEEERRDKQLPGVLRETEQPTRVSR